MSKKSICLFKSVQRLKSLNGVNNAKDSGKFSINQWQWRSTTAALLLILLTALIGFAGLNSKVVYAKAFSNLASQSLGTISVSRLPAQAQEMMTLIYQGGPFKYDKDSTVFGNREQILPIKNRGFYREYTVRTPAERSRGARRIVCGGFKPTAPDACFYTDDHYASFRKIVQ
jgi:ribonuclease T1